MSVFIYPGGSKGPTRKVRLRDARELQRKYDEYSNLIKTIQKRNGGKISKRGTSDGEMRHRYVQAMVAIDKLARRQGIKLR